MVRPHSLIPSWNITMQTGFDFKYSVMWESIPLLLMGMKWTLLITAFGLIIGFLLGAGFGLMRISRHTGLKKLAGIYIESVRGTPIMVQVMFIYFGLPMALNMRVAPVVAGVAAIAVNSGAYIAEVFRGAFQSIDPGQTAAGRSIGLTGFQTRYYIVWPQAFRRMIPPLGNQFIISLKDTSLLVVVGVWGADPDRTGNHRRQFQGVRSLADRGAALPFDDPFPVKNPEHD